MKKKKKIIIAVSIVLVVAIAASTLFSNKGPVAVPVQTVPLTASPLSSTIDASGHVESTNVIKVYAEVTAPIDRVLVKEGDQVAAGDLLAELDSTDLHSNLTQREIALRTGTEASQQRIKLAEKNYSDTQKTINEGTNAQLNSAREQLDAAQRALTTAKENHDIAKARVDQETKDQLIQPRATVDSAQTAYDRANRAYKDAKKDVDDQYDDLKDDIKAKKKEISSESDAEQKKILKQELEELEERLDKFEDENGITSELGGFTPLKSLRQAYDDAQAALTTAKKNLAAAETSANNAATDKMREHVRAVDNAQISYDNALRGVKTIETTISQTLENAQESITSEKIAANTESLQAEIKTLRTNVEKCQVKAPSAGTVTAVYAVENSTATGLLFLIENTEALQVTVKVKEYDIPNIKEGMKAIITADATDKVEYEGIVQKVHPAAIRSEATAAVATNSNVEFEAEVLVQTADTPLRIGMSAKAKIVLEEKDSTLSVSYDALTTDEKGNTIIYTVQKQADDTYQAIALPVQTGLETDFSIEVSGDGITAGIPVISDAKSVTPGMLVTVEGGAQALADAVSSTPAGVSP